MDEFIKLIDETMEELRDYYVSSEKQAKMNFFNALRLKNRGKI